MRGDSKTERTPVTPSPAEELAKVGKEDNGEELLKLLEALLPLLLCKAVLLVGVVGRCV